MKKILSVSLLLIAVCAIIITLSSTAQADTKTPSVSADFMLLPGDWIKDRWGNKIGCIAPGDACGIIILHPTE